MQFVHVAPAQIEREWSVYSETLRPALRQDPSATLQGLFDRLMGGDDVLLEVTGEAAGLVVLEITSGFECWTKYIAGVVTGAPKQRVKTLRKAIEHIEAAARNAGCTQHRICGRDWSSVFPEYKPLDGYQNGLVKGL